MRSDKVFRMAFLSGLYVRFCDLSSRKMNDQCCFQIIEVAMLSIIIVVGFFLRVILLQRYWKPSTIIFACKSRAGTVDLSLVQILIRTRTYFQKRFLIGHKMSI
jgi:hypothetical protein